MTKREKILAKHCLKLLALIAGGLAVGLLVRAPIYILAVLVYSQGVVVSGTALCVAVGMGFEALLDARTWLRDKGLELSDKVRQMLEEA